MIACHECGTVQHMRALPEDGIACCGRCGATLYRQRRDSIEHTLLLTLAALTLFVIANTFPFLTFELEGNADTSADFPLDGVAMEERLGQLEADRLEALARLCVIRLPVGARFAQSVEVEAAAPFERGRGGEIEDRVSAFLDAA
jgi:uncharacterized paraquat-inducible protein A